MNYKALVEHGFERRLRNLREGLSTVLPAGQTFTQAGGTVVVADVIAQIDAYLALGMAADTAEVALKQARQRFLAATPAIYALSENVRTLLRGFHGASHPTLKQFGIPPKKRRKLKMIEEAVAAVRRGQTRVIRGTLGPREKLKYKATNVTLAIQPPKSSKDPKGEE